jgi:4-oxalocrotonate tautomerase
MPGRPSPRAEVGRAIQSRWSPGLAARITDVMVAFEGSEAFREVIWVLIDELHHESWHIGGQPFFGPPSLMSTLSRTKAAYEAIDGTPTTREDLAKQAPVRHPMTGGFE